MTTFNIKANPIVSNSRYGDSWLGIKLTDTKPFSAYAKGGYAVIIRILFAPIKSVYTFAHKFVVRKPAGTWNREMDPGSSVWQKVKDSANNIWKQK